MAREVQTHFIQTCAGYGSLRISDAIEILKPICRKYDFDLPQDEAFKNFIGTLNKKLNKYDHDITFVKYPITKEEYLVFRAVNTKGIRFLNHLTEQDRHYFRLILNTIAVADNYGIPEIRALNLSSLMPDMQIPKKRAEILIQTWKQVGYFVESNDILYLGPKTLVEFDSYLLKYFPEEVKECSLCKKIVLWDPKCDDCEIMFHSECIRKYLIKSSNCPACQKLWNTSFAS